MVPLINEVFELVKNKESKQPFESALKISSRIKDKALRNGLICYPGGGTVDGLRGDHILIAPPFIITKTHISEIIEKLKPTISAAIGFIDVVSKSTDSHFPSSSDSTKPIKSSRFKIFL